MATAAFLPDNVGHLFVKQYYSTLLMKPADLHRFYEDSSSSFSHGEEGSHAPIHHGQKEIHKAILALSYNNCQADITQVDCQSFLDDANVLIQVIGNISNNGAAPRKFAQTFVLHRQSAVTPVKFSLLNDIFRYVNTAPAHPAPLVDSAESASAVTVTVSK